MGGKLAWTGLALLVVTGVLNWSNGFILAGAIILIIGVVLIWLDK